MRAQGWIVLESQRSHAALECRDAAFALFLFVLLLPLVD